MGNGHDDDFAVGHDSEIRDVGKSLQSSPTIKGFEGGKRRGVRRNRIKKSSDFVAQPIAEPRSNGSVESECVEIFPGGRYTNRSVISNS